MIGVIVNAAAILVGACVGLTLKGGLKDRYKTIINQSMGLAVFFVGASSTISQMMQPGANPVLFIISLAAGALLGEFLNIELQLGKVGNWLQSKVPSNPNHGSIATGFVASSLVFCVGTMAVLGALESGIQGRNTIFFAKSLIDGIIAMVMAATLGLGVAFSAFSVLLYQGLLTLLAVWVSPYVTPDMLRELSIVGGILIAAIGLNMLEVIRIKVGNLLPALLGPVLYYTLLSFFK